MITSRQMQHEWRRVAGRKPVHVLPCIRVHSAVSASCQIDSLLPRLLL